MAKELTMSDFFAEVISENQSDQHCECFDCDASCHCDCDSGNCECNTVYP